MDKIKVTYRCMVGIDTELEVIPGCDIPIAKHFVALDSKDPDRPFTKHCKECKDAVVLFQYNKDDDKFNHMMKVCLIIKINPGE